MKRHWRSILAILVLICLVVACVCGYLYYRFTKQPAFNTLSGKAVRLNVYPEASWDDVMDSISVVTNAPLLDDLKWHIKHRAKDVPKVGSYVIDPSITVRSLYNRLVYGMQTPVSLQFNSARLPGQIYRRLGRQLMADSLDIARAMNDPLLLSSLNIQDTTLAYYLIPNTYEVYWDITPDELVRRLGEESKRFWDESRRSKAESLGLSCYEVINLAAIVQEESAKVDEYSMIAGLYINRLRIGMPLQADPTIKFALQDFGLRRILHRHLKVESPYNTYIHKGLPKGPIRIPSIVAIDGVLDATKHDYIYMCAKEDFSGYHNFATTYSEHQRNAKRYVEALNNRGIK